MISHSEVGRFIRFVDVDIVLSLESRFRIVGLNGHHSTKNLVEVVVDKGSLNSLQTLDFSCRRLIKVANGDKQKSQKWHSNGKIRKIDDTQDQNAEDASDEVYEYSEIVIDLII